jgi:hypothetical protein
MGNLNCGLSEARAPDRGAIDSALGSLLRHGTGLAFGAGIVHGDIQATKAPDSVVDQAAHFFFLAYVGFDELGLRAEGMQLFGQSLAGFVSPAGDDDS